MATPTDGNAYGFSLYFAECTGETTANSVAYAENEVGVLPRYWRSIVDWNSALKPALAFLFVPFVIFVVPLFLFSQLPLNHRPDALVGEEFGDDGMMVDAVEDVGRCHAVREAVQHGLHLGQHAARDDAALDQRLHLCRG
jgi:hypothetical protein